MILCFQLQNRLGSQILFSYTHTAALNGCCEEHGLKTTASSTEALHWQSSRCQDLKALKMFRNPIMTQMGHHCRTFSFRLSLTTGGPFTNVDFTKIQRVHRRILRMDK